MNAIDVLGALSIFTVLFCTYHAARNTGCETDLQRLDRAKSRSPRLHFLSAGHGVGPYLLEPQHVLFHLQVNGATKRASRDAPKALGVSLVELERCLPWIPRGSKIFISSAEGFSPTVIDRIKRINTARDLYLIDSQHGSNVLGQQEMRKTAPRA